MFAASSASDISVPNTPISRNREVVNVCPNADDSTKKAKSIGGSVSEIGVDELVDIPRERMSQMFLFQKKQKRGVIDVWWLYDDGGLTLLLPYIISTRRNWNNCKLRVFALANKRDELELEQRNMASLLAKFRIDYSDLQVVSDFTNKPSDTTLQFFDHLIADFRKPENRNDPDSGELDLIQSWFYWVLRNSSSDRCGASRCQRQDSPPSAPARAFVRALDRRQHDRDDAAHPEEEHRFRPTLLSLVGSPDQGYAPDVVSQGEPNVRPYVLLLILVVFYL